VDAWKDINHPKLMAAIPVYAAVDHLHDYVVQAKGAFDETVLGILKLKDRGQRVEIRVVLHALTAPVIEETCWWIARNLPFVDHIALMGLENTGFAIANDAMLWMDPMDYCEGLAKAVDHLAAAGVDLQSSEMCSSAIRLAARAAVDIGLEERICRRMRSMRRKEELQRLFHNRTSAFQPRYTCNHCRVQSLGLSSRAYRQTRTRSARCLVHSSFI
jgi:MoaA/NifB/PqqE/SkfB family radical SAM enzyme